MKKINWVFISLAIIELLAILYIYEDTFNLNPKCRSPCEFHPSFLRPFEPADFQESEMCISMCDYFLPSSFYVISNILILTAIAYVIYLITGRMRK